MEVAASTVCSFSSENTATSPKHVGAPGSNGNSSSVGCSAEAFLVGLLWSNHLRTFGLGRWRFLHGRLNWAAGMYCTVSTRWFSASLIWPVFDSDEDMKVTCSSSIAYMSLHILGSTGRLCFWQQQPLQNATESLIPSALISLGIVCAAPTSSRSCYWLVWMQLSQLVPCSVWSMPPLGRSPPPLFGASTPAELQQPL